MIQRMEDQRGVAALTVMLLTAVLATAGAVVLLTANTELRSGGSDRMAEGAFAAAEGGLDIAASYLRTNPKAIPAGEDKVFLQNPLVDEGLGLDWEIMITSPSGGEWVQPADGGRPFMEYNVYSRAREGEATRTLAAAFRLDVLNLPFGMWVDGNVNLNGTPTLIRESLLVNGTVTDRGKLDTDANRNRQFDDPDLGWEFHKDLIAADPPPDMCMLEGQQVGCVGVYANFQIFSKNSTRNSDEIHFSSSDPHVSEFPRDRDVHQLAPGAERVVDFSAAKDAVLEVMDPLKDMARSQNLYFNFKNGSNETINIQPKDLQTDTRNFEKNVSVYIEADAGDVIKWKVNLIPESPASDMKMLTEDGRRIGPDSGVITLRGGTLNLEAGTQWSGALFVPEGELRLLGGNTCTCTIYTMAFSAQGGNSTIQLTSEWFGRLPGGFVSVTRTAFYECEPYQPSSVCPDD
jgi:hypothetical protein